MPDRIVLSAALALLVGGPARLVLHVLWRIGHGPTVVNEHGVVLGLTNDEWSHLGPLWAVPVAFAVAVVAALHQGGPRVRPRGSPGRPRGRRRRGLDLAVVLAERAGARRWPRLPGGDVVARPCAGTLARRPARRGGRRVGAVRLLAGRHVCGRGDRASVNVDLTDLPVVAQAVTWTALGVALLRRG